MIDDSILILDIETKTFDNQPDPERDIHRVTIFYSYKYNKSFIYTDLDKIQTIINEHDILVGHNIKEYDMPILERAGIRFNHKTIIDTLEIAKKRLKPLMQIDMGSYSLRNLCEELKLSVMKGEIDYNIFQKTHDEWTKEEKQDIIKYCKGDIDATKELFEKFYGQFIVFRQFVSERNKKNWSWLTCSSGTLSYKILCNLAGLEERYGKDYTKKGVGGFVLEPTGDTFEDVWYLDFSSLYPNIFMMFNLFGNPTLRPDCKDWFEGNKIFPLKGKYAKDMPHILSLKYREMFLQRKAIKKSDPLLAYAYKIILNGGYGVMRSAIFESTYYEHTGEDCCIAGQVMNKLIGQFFDNAGFKSVAGDTDSRFLKYTGDLPISEQLKLIKNTKKALLDYINAYAPFPSDTLELESETGDTPIKYIKFIRDGNKYLKKNYLYIHGDKITIKGVPIIKNTATKIGRLILDKYIKPEILKRGNGDFTRVEIMEWVYKELKENIRLAAMEFRVKPYNTYKSKNCIQARISRHFFNDGAGRIELIKNKRYGEIKGSDYYCSLDNANRLSINSLCLEKLDTEFKPFIVEQKRKEQNIFDY